MCRRLLHGELHSAFRTWRGFITNLNVAAIRVQLNGKKRLRIRELIAKFTQASLVPAFHTWLTHVKEQRTLRNDTRMSQLNILDQVLRRMVHSKKHAAMRQWIRAIDYMKEEQYANEQRHQRALILTRCMYHHHSTALNRAMRQWLLYTVDQRSHHLADAQSEYKQNVHTMREENEQLQKKLDEQVEITTYLYKVVQNSV
jgi:hypothetical protein